MATPAAIANSFLTEMMRGNEEVLATARDLKPMLGKVQLEWQAPNGGWTVGQIFEHMIIANQLYMNEMRARLEKALSQEMKPHREWKASLMGGMLMRSMHPKSRRRLPAPGIFKPGPAARPNVIPEFLQQHEELGRIIAGADGVDLRSTKMRSPVTPLIRLNLGDAIGIAVYHSQRHLLQVGRLMTAPGFPE